MKVNINYMAIAVQIFQYGPTSQDHHLQNHAASMAKKRKIKLNLVLLSCITVQNMPSGVSCLAFI